jgi:DNA-binding NarL/FixJ family response regulator
MLKGVVIYEDNLQLRESIAGLINYSNDFILLASFAEALQAEKEVQQLRPEIVLMDIDMPGINGIEAVKKIRKVNSSVHIIMLTVFDDSPHVLDSIFAGASGYILKKHLSDRLLNALHEVLNGGAPMSPSIARMVITSMHTHRTIDDKYRLTPREKDILAALSQGSSNKIIAEKYFITVDTVSSHLKHIYKKLQVHSQVEAVSKVMNERIT